MCVIWKAIPGYPGYEASSAGEVRRVRVGLNGHRPRVLRGAVSSAGYLVVQMGVERKKLPPVPIHRLVALAFHGEPPTPEHEVAHNDGSKTNNAPDNIRWATAKENAADRRLHGTDTIGEQHGMAKLTEAHVAEIIKLYSAGMKQRDIGRRYGIHQAQVHRIVTRKSWGHLDLPPGKRGVGGIFRETSAA